MTNVKYNTVEDVIEAIRSGKIKRTSVSKMINYYKNKGNDRWKIYKKALLLTDPVFDEHWQFEQEKNHPKKNDQV